MDSQEESGPSSREEIKVGIPQIKKPPFRPSDCKILIISSPILIFITIINIKIIKILCRNQKNWANHYETTNSQLNWKFLLVQS